MSKSWAVVLLSVAFPGVAPASSIAANFVGPVSPFYLASGGGISVIQGNRVVRTIPFAYAGGTSEGVFAVSGPDAASGRIRTRASEPDTYDFPIGTAGTYTPSGPAAGTGYSPPPVAWGRVYDGTTDGTWNYFTDHGRGVYRADFYWQNPEFLFDPYGCPPTSGYDDTCDAHGLSGIAFDPVRNSLWISSVPSRFIREYSLTGILLSEFFTPPVVYPGGIEYFGNAALALDPADHTLWVIGRSSGYFQQWSADGRLLESTFLGDLDASFQNRGFYEGAEFQIIAIPEPSAFMLAAASLVMLAAWGRGRQRR